MQRRFATLVSSIDRSSVIFNQSLNTVLVVEVSCQVQRRGIIVTVSGNCVNVESVLHQLMNAGHVTTYTRDMQCVSAKVVHTIDVTC